MRYKIEISYDGSGFYGFQKQPNKETIQECLEKAIKGKKLEREFETSISEEIYANLRNEITE